jgi:hypothetical protein
LALFNLPSIVKFSFQCAMEIYYEQRPPKNTNAHTHTHTETHMFLHEFDTNHMEQCAGQVATWFREHVNANDKYSLSKRCRNMAQKIIALPDVVLLTRGVTLGGDRSSMLFVRSLWWFGGRCIYIYIYIYISLTRLAYRRVLTQLLKEPRLPPADIPPALGSHPPSQPAQAKDPKLRIQSSRSKAKDPKLKIQS